MTLSFIIMPALGCFLIGLVLAKSDRWTFSWILSLIGLVAFISSFWHIERADLWFMLSYSFGPFLMGFGFTWDLSNKRREYSCCLKEVCDVTRFRRENTCTY